MNIITKEITVNAAITPVADDTSEHGEADVILSTRAKDRDGDELLSNEWISPLPDYITFDTDHGMSVATTVGGGEPFINDKGQLQVRVGFSSIDRAQETRTLVNERIIRNVSVTFLQRKNEDGNIERELLNGSFVPIPSNTEAVILSSKSADLTTVETKSGPDGGSDADDEQTGVEAVLRNALTSINTAVQLHNGQEAPGAMSSDDGTYPHLQLIHDAAVKLGGNCASMAPPVAEEGQAWGANSPTISAPTTSGKSADIPASPAPVAADAAMSPDDTAEARSKAMRMAITLSAID